TKWRDGTTARRQRTFCRDVAASVPATGGSLPPPGPPLASSLLPGVGPGVRWGGPTRGPRQEPEPGPGFTPRAGMGQCDAAGVSGGNRILSHGAPPERLMPNGCLGSPAIVLLRS